jgi:hypothetical protein
MYHCGLFYKQYTVKFQYTSILISWIVCMPRCARILSHETRITFSPPRDHFSLSTFLPRHSFARMIGSLIDLRRRRSNPTNTQSHHSYLTSPFSARSLPLKGSVTSNHLKYSSKSNLETISSCLGNLTSSQIISVSVGENELGRAAIRSFTDAAPPEVSNH